ncbi:unnamed protein product [Closterium sp. Yama58-4]|nr:unnamed protein product [Closterium sp. Yama58-4]
MRRPWRLSSRGARWGVERALLGAVWVAGWAGLCAWVVWFAHTQAANPREEAMRGWCHLRVRYLYQRLLSSVSRVQEMSALLRVFNGYGPRSSTNLTYWGVAGCANNESLTRYKDATIAMGLDYLTLGTLTMLVDDSDRALVERITGMVIKSPLGLPSPRKPRYIVNLLSGYPNNDPKAFTDFSAMVPQSLLSSVLEGNAVSSPPVFFNSELHVGTVIVVPIMRHPVPDNATTEQRRESFSNTSWADLSYLGNELQAVLSLLSNGSSTSAYSIAMYDTTDPGQPLGPDPLKMESGSLYPYVLPGPVVPGSKHVEPFPKDLLGRRYEAHCRFDGPYPKWDLVYAPMLLGLLVLLVAVLISLVIVVLAWKRRQMAEGLREMQLCTAALERAEKSKSETVANTSHELRTPLIGVIEALEGAKKPKSETVANTSHELRTPLIGVIGMIDELLESRLEEWQREDLPLHFPPPSPLVLRFSSRTGMIDELLESLLEEWQKADLIDARACAGPSLPSPSFPSRTGMIDELLESRLEEWQKADLIDARACAGETVDLINRVLDLAKLQAGRLQLETLPCCLRRIVQAATSAALATSAEDGPITPGKNLQVTCHVDESVPDVLMGDPTRLAQVIEELTAHAVGNAAGGRVTFHVCFIPPPPSPHVSASCFNLPCASAPAAAPAPSRDPPCRAPHSHASSRASNHLPSGSPAWHQLSACVRRFPPATHLARFRQHLVATTKGAGQAEGASEAPQIFRRLKNRLRQHLVATTKDAGQAEGTSEAPQKASLARFTRSLQRLGASVMGASGMGGSNGASVGEEGEEAEGGSGHGRLEEEVREWVEGACEAREEGEWMVVMACEDSGGGIPPEELRWVLDPHGDSHHAPSHAADDAVAPADGEGDEEDGQGIKVSG